MKELQNNFTTPEQSKRLLELGMPANSADLFYNRYADAYYGDIQHIVVTIGDVENLRFGNTIPCWSVGRLIEIWNICVNLMPDMDLKFLPFSDSYIEDLVRCFELTKEDGLVCFSELED